MFYSYFFSCIVSATFLQETKLESKWRAIQSKSCTSSYIPHRDIRRSRDVTKQWEHFRCAVCFFWTGLWGEGAGCFCSNHPIRRICNRNLKICAADTIRHKIFSTIRWERGFLITPVPVTISDGKYSIWRWYVCYCERLTDIMSFH